jgi:hypothetical protein
MELLVITKNRTYMWLSVTHIFRSDYPNYNGSRKSFMYNLTGELCLVLVSV